ncbi:MAG: hypothetical protein K9M44_03575 [Candidatus Pacebacteria bacterium]|nr:hypothetical protein [Candidatus Paceibacterota bacterium]
MIADNILKAIKNQDLKTLNKLKKQIVNKWFTGTNKEATVLTKELIIEFEKHDNINLKIAINSFLNWLPLFSIGRNLKTELEIFILTNILHSNGQIRQQTVKIGRSFIYSFTFAEKEKHTVYIISFVKKIITLIYKYEVKNKEEIEREKPCQYKSLMFLLEEITSDYFLENFVKSEPLKKQILGLLDNFYDEYFYDDFTPSFDSSSPEKKEDIYYDAMEMLNFGDWQRARRLLEEGLKEYSDYIELYVGLASVFRFINDDKNLEEIVETGFKKLKERFPEWPKEMFWGYLSNRQFLRMIDFKALVCFKKGDKKQAEELYGLLLKLNPGDNQGARYYLAGLYENISPEEVDNMSDLANKKQNWEYLENLVYRQNKKYGFLPNLENEDEEEISEDEEDPEEDIKQASASGFRWNLS